MLRTRRARGGAEGVESVKPKDAKRQEERTAVLKRDSLFKRHYVRRRRGVAKEDYLVVEAREREYAALLAPPPLPWQMREAKP